MFRKIVASAVFAGFAAGLIAAGLQIVLVQPVLLQAELYETGRLVHFGSNAAAAGDEAAALLAEQPTAMRGLMTSVFTALVFAALGLVMVSGFALAERGGAAIGARTGLLWGAAGFVAAQLAPSVGLPPELPGMAAGALPARQVWWFATVAATATGLWLVAFGAGWRAWAAALALIAAPHVIGAPQPAALLGPAPPELGALFAARSLATGLAGWSLLGLFAGYLWRRDSGDARIEAPRTA